MVCNANYFIIMIYLCNLASIMYCWCQTVSSYLQNIGSFCQTVTMCIVFFQPGQRDEQPGLQSVPDLWPLWEPLPLFPGGVTPATQVSVTTLSDSLSDAKYCFFPPRLVSSLIFFPQMREIRREQRHVSAHLCLCDEHRCQRCGASAGELPCIHTG